MDGIWKDLCVEQLWAEEEEEEAEEAEDDTDYGLAWNKNLSVKKKPMSYVNKQNIEPNRINFLLSST